MSLLNRFNNMFTHSRKCWIWNFRKNEDGYGELFVDGKKQKAHRISYQLFKGDIPKGLFVLHKCDNPSCINPDHLFLGTNADNMNDMKLKGRASRLVGSLNGRAKLTDKSVQDIRQDNRRIIDIANDYSVSFSLISKIKRQEIWRHI